MNLLSYEKWEYALGLILEKDYHVEVRDLPGNILLQLYGENYRVEEAVQYLIWGDYI